jgi:hypothetical protein
MQDHSMISHWLKCECGSERRGTAAFRRYGFVSVCGIWARNAHSGSLSPRAGFGVSFLDEGVFAAGVPSELGGGGASYTQLCELLRVLAHYSGSTALTLSMHTHLVATASWRW